MHRSEWPAHIAALNSSGDEQVQLHGFLVLYTTALPNIYETVATVPALGFPSGLEKAPLVIQRLPALSFLNNTFECDKPLKGYANRKLDTPGFKHMDNGIAEEGAIHADFDNAPGQHSAYLADAILDEGLGSIGVMHIAGSMPHIQYLTCLGHSTEQRVIAALAFLLAIEAHCRAFGKSPGRNHRAIEIQGYTSQALKGQPIRYQLPMELTQIINTPGVHPGQCPTDCGDIRQAGNSEQSSHHRIILVITQILQASIADQQVGNQQQHDQSVAKDGGDLQVSKAVDQLLLQLKPAEQGLKHKQTGEGGQLLVFKAELGDAVRFTMNIGFASLHADGFLWFYCLVGANNSTKSRPFFIR